MPLALLLALVLTLALLLSSTHVHRDGAGVHACAACAVLADAMPGTLPDAAPLPRAVPQRHLAHAAQRYRCLYRAAALLPPSCGPPWPHA
jgi:hypothetical protein